MSEDTCPICLDALGSHFFFWNTRILRPCGHVYHTSCMYNMFLRTGCPLCPICRSRITSVDVPWFRWVWRSSTKDFFRLALIDHYHAFVSKKMFVIVPRSCSIYKLPCEPYAVRAYMFSVLFNMFLRDEIDGVSLRYIYDEFIMKPRLDTKFTFGNVHFLISS